MKIGEAAVRRGIYRIMKLDLDLKTLITIITFAAVIGGFYYTTQDRLTHLEENVVQLQKQIKRIARLNKK